MKPTVSTDTRRQVINLRHSHSLAEVDVHIDAHLIPKLVAIFVEMFGMPSV